jgi:hypothetical protein
LASSAAVPREELGRVDNYLGGAGKLPIFTSQGHSATDPVGVKESSPGQRPGEPKVAQPKALKGRKSSGALSGRDPVGTDKFPGRCPGLDSASLSG